MINIHKLIKSVKSGKLSFNSFNLRIKKADAADDYIKKMEEERQKKEQMELSKVPGGVPAKVPANVPGGVPAKVPANVPGGVLPDVSDQPPQEISPKERGVLRTWIINNKTDMENEARKSTEQLKKDMKEGVLPFLADINVYKLVHDNKIAHDILVSDIGEMTDGIDVAKANVFVDTSLFNSKKFFDELRDAPGEVEGDTPEEVGSIQAKGDAEIARIAALEEVKKEEAMQRKLKKNQFARVDPLPDPELDKAFIGKWYSMVQKSERDSSAAAELEAAKDIMGEFGHIPDEPSNASYYRFGHMQEGQVVDQKINFFLNYPQHLSQVVDDELRLILKVELKKANVDVGDGALTEIMNSLTNLKGEGVTGGMKGQAVRILTKLRGQKLYDILRGLIEKGDKDIYDWVGKRIHGKERVKGLGVERTRQGDPEVSSANVGIEGDEDKRKPADVRDIYLEHQASEIVGHIAGKYLSPDAKNAHAVMKSGLGRMSSDTINKFKTSKGKDKKEALDNYNTSEELLAFSMPMIDHLDGLFKNKGEKLLRDPKQMAFRNKKGKIFLPKDIVRDVTRGPTVDELADGEEQIPIDDYPRLSDRYMERVRKGTAKSIVPKWSSLVSVNYPVEVFKKMSKLKQNIKQIAKVNKIAPDSAESFDIVRKHLPGMLTGGLDTLSDFAGVEEGDSNEEQKSKIDNFIYMTLSQSDFHVKWLGDLGPLIEGKPSKAKTDRAAYDNILSSLGGKVFKLFGYLANEKDMAEDIMRSEELLKKAYSPEYKLNQAEIDQLNQMQPFTEEDKERSKMYTDGALTVAIGLLDQSLPLRNFLVNGSRINKIDRKRRTNTELYYSLRGIEPPPVIKAILEISNKGREKAEEKAARGEISRPKLETTPHYEGGSWYEQFFQKYKTFDPIIRAKQEAVDKYKKVDRLEDELYQAKNQIILKNIGGKKYDEKLKLIKDERYRQEIKGIIEEWRAGPSTEHLDSTVYKALGFNTFDQQLKKFEKQRKKIENGLPNPKKINQIGMKRLKLKALEVNNDLKAILLDPENQIGLEEAGFDTKDLIKRLKLARKAYDRAMFKIAALEEMKKHNVKFASVNNIDYLDLQIAKVKTDFDNYFRSLFS
jgi:hypothetical protein